MVRSLNQRDAVPAEDRSELRAAPKFATGFGGELRDGTVVDGHVFVTVQSGPIPESVEPVGALIDGQAGPVTKSVRTRPYGIGRHTEGDRVAAPQIDRVEARLDGDVDMDIVTQIVGT
jgi:hypothetical protein